MLKSLDIQVSVAELSIRLWFFIGLTLLAACAPPPQARVVERTTISAREEAEKIGGSLIRIVEPGDTLHAIAFVAGKDVNELAAWNDISDTAKLRVGQRIRMTKPLNFKPRPAVYAKPGSKPRTAIVAVETAPGAAGQSSALPPSPAPSTRVLTPAEVTKKSSATVRAAAALSGNNSIRWAWPVNGAVVGRFALADGRQGVDIQAKAGQPVIATSAGEVVYVGNGLKGYGNLVIIKHSDTFLSAYAHNRETFVREGERVPTNHVIGSIGLDRQRRNALHFQIRKNGKPVNPLLYLPKI